MFIKLKALPNPEDLRLEYPLAPPLAALKAQRDQDIKEILSGEQDRFILIVGPCSADQPDSVLDYVSRLAKVQEQVKDKLLLIPRIYTNKPRTTGIGYKGMLHQPQPNQEEDIYKGIVAIRKLHIQAIAETGLTSADEMLYPENVPFLNDLLSYHAVGARSVENQQHRLTSSGLDVPIGMKNPTSGDLTVMYNSVLAAQSPHVFLYRQEAVETTSNPLAHGILRGSVNKHGESIPNYHYEDLTFAAKMYKEYDLKNPALIVDLNHSNSNKQFQEQPRIAKEVLNSRRYNPELKALIKGFMLESYIVEGSRPIDQYVYGQSITDACLGWSETEELIFHIREKV